MPMAGMPLYFSDDEAFSSDSIRIRIAGTSRFKSPIFGPQRPRAIISSPVNDQLTSKIREQPIVHREAKNVPKAVPSPPEDYENTHDDTNYKLKALPSSPEFYEDIISKVTSWKDSAKENEKQNQRIPTTQVKVNALESSSRPNNECEIVLVDEVTKNQKFKLGPMHQNLKENSGSKTSRPQKRRPWR